MSQSGIESAEHLLEIELPSHSLTDSSITESHIADDAALYTTSRPNLNAMTCEFVAGAELGGLTISMRKTKAMAVGPGSVDNPDDIGNGNMIALF